VHNLPPVNYASLFPEKETQENPRASLSLSDRCGEFSPQSFRRPFGECRKDLTGFEHHSDTFSLSLSLSLDALFKGPDELRDFRATRSRERTRNRFIAGTRVQIYPRRGANSSQPTDSRSLAGGQRGGGGSVTSIIATAK